MIQILSKHEGLGDTIEYITEKTGIKYAVEKAAKMAGIEDCGCGRRKGKANKLLNYGREKK